MPYTTRWLTNAGVQFEDGSFGSEAEADAYADMQIESMIADGETPFDYLGAFALGESWAWYSVETPSVFLEYRLPVDDDTMVSEHRAQLAELKALAERYSTNIRRSPVRRG